MTSHRDGDAPNLRTGVRRAAAEANVDVNDYERAIVLGQVAELLALHPQIGGRIAFKGGAVMTLFDGSPRLSRDLDAVLVSGGRITEKMVREALGTPAAKMVVGVSARLPCTLRATARMIIPAGTARPAIWSTKGILARHGSPGEVEGEAGLDGSNVVHFLQQSRCSDDGSMASRAPSASGAEEAREPGDQGSATAE